MTVAESIALEQCAYWVAIGLTPRLALNALGVAPPLHDWKKRQRYPHWGDVADAVARFYTDLHWQERAA